MIKIKRKIIKEEMGGSLPTTVPATTGQNTSTEKTVDDAAVAAKLNKFSQLGSTSQVINALTQDFKLLTGDQRYISLSQFLTSIGINKADLGATANKMK